jgi:hypothetical protein
MSHCKVQYVKTPPTKIAAPGSAGTLATGRMSAKVGKTATAGPTATACSKATTEMPTTPGMQEIAGRPATGNHQELQEHQQ